MGVGPPTKLPPFLRKKRSILNAWREEETTLLQGEGWVSAGLGSRCCLVWSLRCWDSHVLERFAERPELNGSSECIWLGFFGFPLVGESRASPSQPGFAFCLGGERVGFSHCVASWTSDAGGKTASEIFQRPGSGQPLPDRRGELRNVLGVGKKQ